jgi:hypothetical protein
VRNAYRILALKSERGHLKDISVDAEWNRRGSTGWRLWEWLCACGLMEVFGTCGSGYVSVD